jgi:prevent-host-death family protein
MKVNIHEAKTTLSRLIARAQAGDDVVIARDNVPVARLVPIRAAPVQRKPGTLRGVVRIPKSFFEPLPPEELDAWEGRSR